MTVGKGVIEDRGISLGRSRDWPAIPKGLYNRAMSSDSTTIVCERPGCGQPWGGLVYDVEEGIFRHRKPCKGSVVVVDSP